MAFFASMAQKAGFLSAIWQAPLEQRTECLPHRGYVRAP